MMGQLAVVDAAVEADHHRRPHLRLGPPIPDLLQADDLGPEPVRFLDVVNVEDDVIDPDGARNVAVVPRFTGPVPRHQTLLPWFAARGARGG